MKNHQDNPDALPALLRAAGRVDTLETNSLCCAAAGIIDPSGATAEVLIPHEKLRGAAPSDATLTAPERPLAQPVLGYTHTSNAAEQDCPTCSNWPEHGIAKRNTMKPTCPDNQDLWTTDSFEDSVAAALITCFETRIKRNKGAGPNTLTHERMNLIRGIGPYIPSKDRFIIAPSPTNVGEWEFDITNDPLPTAGCIGFTRTAHVPSDEYGGYFQTTYVRKASTLPKTWHRRSGGQLYEIIIAASENNFIEGDRSFFCVTKEGKVVACEQRFDLAGRYKTSQYLTTPEKELKGREAMASIALQFIADSRYCWTIEARESNCFARLGSMPEQIKSLLYARSIPLTDTGRKRPILHLVVAHQRRLKSGIDIDITGFLRGIQTVEIGGTYFTVKPARALLPELSAGSRSKYATSGD